MELNFRCKEVAMPSHSILRTRSSRFSMLALAASTFGFLLASCQKSALPRQNDTLSVTINATDPNSLVPTYAYAWGNLNTPPRQRCDFANNDPPEDNRTRYVCLGDTIQWVAVTPKDSSGMMHSAMLVVHEDAIMLKHGASTKSFLGQDGKADGGTVDPNAVRDQPHEYRVVVVDRVGKQVYIDDPTIVIGTGH
jgi:hypothetical protein